jgi:hypothetical protein
VIIIRLRLRRVHKGTKPRACHSSPHPQRGNEHAGRLDLPNRRCISSQGRADGHAFCVAAKKAATLAGGGINRASLFLDLIHPIAYLTLVDSIVRPYFLAAVERKPRIECFCQSVAFMESTSKCTWGEG